MTVCVTSPACPCAGPVSTRSEVLWVSGNCFEIVHQHVRVRVVDMWAYDTSLTLGIEQLDSLFIYLFAHKVG